MAPASRVRRSEHDWGTLLELAAPEVRNALDPVTVAELSEVFAVDAPGAIVLAGDGPVFCAGGDVSVLASATRAGEIDDLLATAGSAFSLLIEQVVMCPRPVVAAVGGAAVGGGLSLALACDVRIAGSSARLVPGWGRWGLPPDGGASALLAAALGPLAARSLLVLGTELPATSPLGPLVFAEVVEDGVVLDAAIATAGRLDTPGARAAKAVTQALMLPLLRAQLDVELAALRAAAQDPAFAEKLAAAR